MDFETASLKNLYTLGYIAASPQYQGETLFGEYQLIRFAEDSFETLYRQIKEQARDDVRDEEMEVADRVNNRLRQELKDARFNLIQQLKSFILSNRIEDEYSTDGEQWAANESWNAALALMEEKLTSELSHIPNV